MMQKKFEEIDLIDILVFFWNRKILILAFSVIGLLIGFILSSNYKPSYENIQKIYFHDNKERIINNSLEINIFDMYFKAALSKERQNEFLMSKSNSEEANTIPSSFMINDDQNAKWVKIKHVHQNSNFSGETISYEYAKYIRDHVNDRIRNMIERNLEAININYLIEETRIKNEILIQKNLETKLNELRKQVLNNNIEIAEKLGIESPSNLLQVLENKSSAYALSIEQYGDSESSDFPSDEVTIGQNIASSEIEFVKDENKLFLYGTIVLKSALEFIEQENQITNYTNTIKLEKIQSEKNLNTLQKKLFYKNHQIDVNDIKIVTVSSYDNTSSVKIGSKFYPHIGLIIGLLLGLIFSVIYAGMLNRFKSEV